MMRHSNNKQTRSGRNAPSKFSSEQSEQSELTDEQRFENQMIDEKNMEEYQQWCAQREFEASERKVEMVDRLVAKARDLRSDYDHEFATAIVEAGDDVSEFMLSSGFDKKYKSNALQKAKFVYERSHDLRSRFRHKCFDEMSSLEKTNVLGYACTTEREILKEYEYEYEKDIPASDYFDQFCSLYQTIKDLIKQLPEAVQQVLDSKVMKVLFDVASSLYQMIVTGGIFEKTLVLVKLCANYMGEIPDYIYKLCTKIVVWVKENFNSQTMGDVLNNTRKFWDTLVSGSFAVAVRELLLALVSFKWFGKKTSKAFTSLLGKPEGRMPILQMFSLLLETIEKFFKFASAWASGVPISELIFSANPVDDFVSKTEDLLLYKDRLYTGLPVEGRMCMRKFRKECNDLLDAGNYLLREMSPYDASRRNVKRLTNELLSVKGDIVNFLNSESRSPPISIVLHGDPEIGKSKLLTLAPRVYANVVGVEYDDSHIFHRNMSSQYWEGYVPPSHPYIHYSEVGNESVNLARKNGSAVMQELNSLIDGVGFDCNMAFDTKGKVFADPWMVLIDTNNADMHIEELMSYPSAMFRRFLFVEAQVLHEFRKDGSTAIDMQKSLASDRAILDKYKFNVYEYIPDGKTAVRKPLRTAIDVFELSEFYRDFFVSKLEREAELSERDMYGFVDDLKAESITIEPRNWFLQWGSENASRFVDNAMDYSRHGWKVMLLWSVVFIMWLIDSFMRFEPEKKKKMVIGFVVGGIALWAANLWYIACIQLILFVIVTRTRCKLFIANFVDEKVREQFANEYDKAKTNLKYQLGITRFQLYYTPERARRWMMALGALAATTATCFIVRKLLKRFEVLITSQSHSEFVEDVPVNEVINEYEEKSGCDQTMKRYKTNLSPAWNVAEMSLGHGIYTGDLMGMMELVHRNLYSCKVSHGAGFRKAHILGLKGQFAVMNTHMLPPGKCTLHITRTGEYEPNSVHTVVVTDNMRIDIGNDITVLRTANHITFKDILKHVIDGDIPSASTGMIEYNKTRVVLGPGSLKVHDNTYGDIILTKHVGYKHDHYDGLCGKPIIVELRRSIALLGIHTAGSFSVKHGFASVFNKALIESTIETLILSDPNLQLFSQSEILEPLEMPVSKSPMRYEVIKNLKYYGKLLGPVLMNNRSRMYRTKPEGWQKLLKDNFDFERTEMYAVPMMKPKSYGGKYISPWNIAIKKMDRDHAVLDEDVLAKIIDVYSTRIISMLEERGVESLHPITFEDATNGSEDDFYLRRINASTSGGYGYNGKKSKFIPIVNEEPFTREMVENLKERMSEIFATYEKEEMVNFIYTAQLKDEPRLVEKVVAGKTRVFYMSPLDLLIFARVYLSPLYTLMVQHSDVFGTAIGFDMHKAAQGIVSQLDDFSPYKFEGDYSGFDVSNPFGISKAACTVSYRVLEHFGYNEHALKMVQGLMTDVLFPNVCMNRDLFVKPGMQPSGKYGTAEDNSLRGILMLMYAWYADPNLCDKDFWENVKPLTYGDDVLAAIKPDCIDHFNNLTYAKACKDHFNMDFTAADKGAVLEKYTTTDRMSFLKRKFGVHPVGKCFVARLSMNSIYKMVEWTIPSDVVTEENQLYSTYISALYEIYLHCDKQTQYDNCKLFFQNALAERFEGEIRDYGFPSWNQLGQHFFQSIDVNMEENVDSIYLEVDDVNTEGRIDISAEYDKCEHELISVTRDIEDMKLDFDPELILRCKKRGLIRKPLCSDEAIELFCLKKDLELTLEKYRRMILSRHDLLTQSGETPELMEGVGIHVDVDENLVDHTGNESYVNDFVEHKFVMDIGQKETREISEFFSRPVEIANFDLTLDTHTESEWKVWDLYTLDPTVRAKLRNYAYLRGNLVLKIVISGTPFHYGKVLFSYQPFAVDNVNITAHESNLALDALTRFMYVAYLSQSQGAIVADVKMNRPLIMRLPYVSHMPMFRLYNQGATAISDVTSFGDIVNAGSLFVFTVNSPRAIGDAPTAVNVQMFAHMENVQLGSPTATVLEITTESGYSENLYDEKKVGYVEKMCTSLATVSGRLSVVPSISPVAKASEMMFTGLSGIASWFGWSRPPLIDKPMFVKNRPFANSANMMGFETIERIVGDTQQELTIDPRVCGTEDDEMSLSLICSRESYVATEAWVTSDDPMIDHVFISKVSPQIGYPYLSMIQPSPLGFAAAPFKFWRGSVTFRFEIVCSAFHRGKIAIYWEPNCFQQALISADVALNKNHIQIFDIQEVQDIQICVEWASPWAWKEVLLPAGVPTLYGPDIDFTTENEAANGFIGVVPFTRLQSPDGSQVEINVYIKSDEMQFNFLSEQNLPTERLILTESGESTHLYDHEVKCEVLNPTSGSSAYTSDFHFGEQPMSFRTCLKRYASSYDSFTAVNGTYKSIRLERPLYTPERPAYGASGASNLTLLEYLPYAYLGVRGGVRKRVRFVSELTRSDRQGQVVVSLGVATSSTSVAASTLPARTKQKGSVQYVPDTNGGVEFEIPYYSRNLFKTCFNDSFTGQNAVSELDTYVAMWDYVVTLVVDDNILIVEDRSIGEDFCFMRFCGAPLFSYS